jgi:hypothetical protein
VGLSPKHYEDFREQARRAFVKHEKPEASTHATFQLYIGANNDTGFIDQDTLLATLAARHDGWTRQSGLGSWRGNTEPVAIVTISDDRAKVLETARILRDELGQEAIGVTEAPAMVFV